MTPLTAVVPLRLDGPPGPARVGLRRLDRLLASLEAAGLAALVADDTADPARAADAARVAARRGARRLSVTETRGRPFSIGRLRDLGTEAAAEGPVLFHDVDFAAPPAAWRALRATLSAKIAGDVHAFRCVPVWFLARPGLAAWRAAPGPTARLLSAAARAEAAARANALDGRDPPPPTPALRAARGLANRLVLGSSAIVLHRRGLIDLGGHDPAYEGHGAEDFELLDRLARRRPPGPRPPDYATDFGSRDRGGRGFRAWFARAGLDLAAEGRVLAHLWHPGRTGDARYYARRAENFARLKARLAQDR